MHPAVSSLEACPTPAPRTPSSHRASANEGRHQTTLNRSGSSSSGSKSLRSGRSLTLLDCLTPPLRCLVEATGSVGRLVIAQRKWNVGIESVLSLRLMCARLFGTTLAQTLKPETLASPCQSKKCEAQLNKVGRAADSPNAKRPWPQPLRSRPAGGRTRSPLATGSGTARRLPER